MIRRRADLPIISLSTAVYDLLLFLYPARFQREYGPQMAQVFRDCCLRAFHQNGGVGMFELWVLTLFDLARSVVEVHTQKETGMTNSNFTRLSGWALMLGAFAFYLFLFLAYLDGSGNLPVSLEPLYSYSWFGAMLLCPVLLAVGLLGLRSRYGEVVGGFGKQVLLVGVVAGLALSLIGIVGEAALKWEWAWWLQGGSLVVSFACLALFGVPALSRRPLPRWNALPLLAGIWFPVLFLMAVIDEMTGNPMTALSAPLLAMLTVSCAALFLLGFVLQGDASQERPAFT